MTRSRLAAGALVFTFGVLGGASLVAFMSSHASRLFLQMVRMSFASEEETPLEEEPSLDAKLGGITAVLPVVDARRAGMAALQIQQSTIQDEVRKNLRSSTVRVIGEKDALESMKGVAVLHVSVNAVVDEKSQMAAFKVDVACLRPALIDRRKYAPIVIVWRKGGIGLYPVNEAEQGMLKAVDDYLGEFVSKLRAASTGAFSPAKP